MLGLNNLKNRTAMNVKTSVFVIFVDAFIYLLLYNLHDCTFNTHMTPLHRKNPMQCCPRGSGQRCTGKNPVQYCLNRIWSLFGDFYLDQITI